MRGVRELCVQNSVAQAFQWMRNRRLAVAVAMWFLLLPAALPAQSSHSIGQAEPGFLQLPKEITLGACSAVTVNRQGEIILFHRAKPPILVFDSKGQLLRSWGDKEIPVATGAHGLRVDADDNVWVTDIAQHRVFKFSPRGKLLLALGTGRPGDAEDAFNKPTDIAFGKDGDVYVSDGYGNNRVMKFRRDGRFLLSWGKRGVADGEFHLPHAILIDSQERVLVGDRENDRIQLFDEKGSHLATWKGFAPYGMAFDPKGDLYVADARASKILKLDSEGRVLASWGTEGSDPGQFRLPHMLGFDAAGNLFVAEVGNKRMQKFRR